MRLILVPATAVDFGIENAIFCGSLAPPSPWHCLLAIVVGSIASIAVLKFRDLRLERLARERS